MFIVRQAVFSIIITIGLLFKFNLEQPFDVAFKNSMMGNGTLNNVLFISIFIFFINKKNFLEKNNIQMNFSILQWLISSTLALFQLFRVSLLSTDTITVTYSSVPNLAMSACIIVTYIFLFNLVQAILLALLEKKEYTKVKNNSKIENLLEDHPFAFTLSVIFICWLPVIVINYPTILVVDAFRQLRQYYGEVPITNAHPPIHTILFGASVSLGRKMGSADLGLFISNIPQIISTALAMGLSSVVLNKLQAPRYLKWLTLCVASISPAVLGMILVSTKDLLFASCVLILYCLAILYYLDNISYKEVKKSKQIWQIFSLLILATLVILLRKNGIYMILPLILVAFLNLIAKLFQKYENNKTLFRSVSKGISILLLLLVPIFLSREIDNYLINKYDMLEGVKKSEMLSIPFQQTARYVKQYPDEVTKEEEAAIRKVLDYDNLGNLYRAHVSDNVKRTTPIDVTSKELREYFKVWGQMFIKHPEIYLESTISQNFYLFSPENLNNYYSYLENGIIKKHGTKEAEKYKKIMKKLGITDTRAKMRVQSYLIKIFKVIDSMPLFNILSNFSLAIIVLMMLFGIAVRKKCNKTILLCLPIIMLLATLFAGPIVRGYIRYSLPFIFLVPIIFAYLFYELNFKKNNTYK